MTRSPLCRRLLGTALPAAMLLGTAAPIAMAEPLIGSTVNTYGMPGLIDMPTAEVNPDGQLGVTTSYSDLSTRNTLTFQITPRLTGALRYSKMDGFDRRLGYVWDRSFDIRYQLLEERGNIPAVAIGMQDFMGTGLYSAEYIVATKSFGERLRVTGGLGWGRLGSRGGIGAPFGHRPELDYGEGGKPNFDQWFRGEAAFFGGLSYQFNDKLTLIAEYSSDAYKREEEEGTNVPDNGVNLGFNYRFNESYNLGGYVLGGEKVGLNFTIAMDPRKAPYPSGLERAGAPVRPRPAPNADPEGWSGNWANDPTAQPAIQKALADSLAKEGQILESMSLNANRAELRIRNLRYSQQAEVIGRTARIMTRALPPSVETFVITSTERGLATSSVTLRRSDIERLENTPATEIAKVAVVTDADPRPYGLVATEDAFPRFQWSLTPYMSTGLFDPDEPFSYEIGASLNARYELMPGLLFTGTLRQRAFGNLGPEGDRVLPESTSGVPIVRSDSRNYTDVSGPTIPRLTVAWYAQPSETIYTRFTGGLLERAYGGVSGEVLWKPNDSRLALGAEVNRVRKRDYNVRFDFQDYEVTTGHISAYYDFGNGFVGSAHAGRYLAGDEGVTLALDREFANGWKVGAFVTKTNLSDEQYGEGSYDKGITLSIPLSWATGQPSKETVGGNLRSLSRDGGSFLSVQGRLYDTVRESQKGKIYEGWGRFWR